MRILLLQDEIYLPSMGGGIKANRLLLEGLAGAGHSCAAVTRALTRSPDGPQTWEEFTAELGRRRIATHQIDANTRGYEHLGVKVHAGMWADVASTRGYVTRQIDEFCPDWIIVADDKRRWMLPCAMHVTPRKVVLLVQTIVSLPFGPLATHPNDRQTEMMRQSRGVFVISKFLQRYVRTHGQLESKLVRLPVYGEGPFPDLSSFDSGAVTMVNPCPLKGLQIFLALAREFPELPFAAVPTWGADDNVLRELQSLANVRIWSAEDDIETILRQTRVLVVPSLWPETFGYVVPEAMVRGIPVMASDVGGLPEAKLGVDYVLPVRPARLGDPTTFPDQDVKPWAETLRQLVGDRELFTNCSRASRQAALEFVRQAAPRAFEEQLASLGEFTSALGLPNNCEPGN